MKSIIFVCSFIVIFIVLLIIDPFGRKDEPTPKIIELQTQAEHIDSTLHALHAKVDTLLYLQRFELNLMDLRYYEIDSLVNELK